EAVAKTVLDRVVDAEVDWVKRNRAFQSGLDFEVAVAKKKRADARRADTTPSRELKAYRGRYEERAYGGATVSLDDDKLTLKWGKFTYRLDHYHFDTFTAVLIAPASESRQSDRTTLDAQFRLGADGDVESLLFLGQEFRRVKEKK